MWVKNTETGHVWLVDEEHGKRLLKQDYYEEVEAPKAASKKKSDVDEKSK
ncbi:DUF7302 family protein [Fictibacillus gelatini]|nr:hypothetical protein [Fictibacillus gelatini]